jgi:hypothetical protein
MSHTPPQLKLPGDGRWICAAFGIQSCSGAIGGMEETTDLRGFPEGQKPCRTRRWDNMNRSLTTEEAADRIGVAAATLRDWKGQRCGPPFVQVTNRCVRYREDDVEKFISDRRVVPTVRQLGRFNHAPVHAAKKSVSVL